MAAPIIPTTTEIATAVISDIEGKIAQSIPFLPKAVFRVMGFAWAGVATILYKYAGWQYLQIFPITAGEKALELWGELVNIIRAPAQSAQLQIMFVGTNGQTIYTGTKILNTLTQVVYTIDTDVTVVDNVATTTMTAITPGINGNLPDGSAVSIVTSLPGISNSPIITDTIVFGADKEDLEVYRARVVGRFQRPPQGGAYSDYRIWAEEVATIINAYPYAGDQESYVQVYSESEIGVDGIPDSTELTAVFDSINLPNRRPVCARVLSLPIYRATFNVKIYNLTPINTKVQDDIESSLTEYLLNREPYIDGLSVNNKSVITSTQLISVIDEAAQVNGSSFTDAQFFLSTAPTTDVAKFILGEGQKAKLGTITYATL